MATGQAKKQRHFRRRFIAIAKCRGAPSRAVSKLPVGGTLYHEVLCNHDDSAVVLYLQAPSPSLTDTALGMVLEQMLAVPFFNSLRTEQQLGYIVGTGYVPHNQHPGMAFIYKARNAVQSSC